MNAYYTSDGKAEAGAYDAYYSYWTPQGFPAMSMWNPQDRPNGLGFLPVAAAAPVVAGPIIGAIGGAAAAVGSFFGKLFGADDQKTSYRPPANSAQQFVHLADQWGDEYVAFDVNAASLAEAARRGNREEDIYSYYSAFLSNSTSAGASKAARNVIEDAAKKHGASISRVGDWLLTTAGIFRITQPFLPSGQGGSGGGGGGAAAMLPPYCPAGTYHPYPIGHPQQDLCIPFPATAGPSQAPTTPTQPGRATSGGGATGGQQPGGAQLTVPATPQGTCPAGYVFNPQIGVCVRVTQQGSSSLSSLFSANIGGIPWWLIILLLIVISQSGGNGGGYYRGRR